MTVQTTHRPLLRFANEYVNSAVPLSCLLPVAHDCPRPDRTPITIRAPKKVEALSAISTWDQAWDNRRGQPMLQIVREGERHRLRMPGLSDFLIHAKAGTLEIEQCRELDADTLEHLLVDQALPRLLAERGARVLHAGVSVIGESGILFLGDSGWGKSTLTALLQQRGYPLLSDDCIILEHRDDALIATPTYPSLRLYEDSIAQTDHRLRTSTQVAFYNTKRRLALTAEPDVSIPVRAAYVLNDPGQPVSRPRITPIAPAPACIEFVRHSLRLEYVLRVHRIQHTRQAAAVASCLPCFTLAYPRDFASSDQLLDTLLAHATGIDG